MKRSLQEDKKKQVDDKGNIKQSAPPEGTTETRQFKQRKQEHQLLQQQEQEQQKRKEELETQRIRERMHRDVVAYKSRIRYSEIYKDEEYQYRHVTLPPQIAQYLPDKNLKILLRESEYRRLGVNISSGWEHYMIYQPEPNILLLKRSIEFAKKVNLINKKRGLLTHL
ncbi:regulatory subunit of cyclin-dependent kinase [Chlamydoabsidia padenii]|nr:regulatory subunit of cyclin-dependent kinase [Chlamydoabsidia padenii]